MKLHYALAALAVAAMSFGASAQTTNLLEGAIPHAPADTETPYQKGWRFTGCQESDFIVTPNIVNDKVAYRTSCVDANTTEAYPGNETVLYVGWTNRKYAYPIVTEPMTVYKLSGHMWRRNGGDNHIDYNFYIADNINGDNPASATTISANKNGVILDMGANEMYLYTSEGEGQMYFLWNAVTSAGWDKGGLVEDVALVKDATKSVVKVSYVTNNGTEISPSYFVVGDNSTINTLPRLTPNSGYYFEGWCTDEACTQMVTLPLAVTTNTTLYAKMTKKPVSDNYMNMWDGHGKGSADWANDFGWTATPNVTWTVTFTGATYANGYRDDSPVGDIRTIISNDTGSVFSYPVVGLTKGYYKFTAKASHINRPGAVHTFAISENIDGTGKVYGASGDIVMPNWPNAGVPVNFEFEIENDVDVAYMCWTMGNAGDRAMSWDYSLIKVEYSDIYAQKKVEAEALLADEAYANVTGEERTALEALANATEEPADYSQAINAINEAMNTFKAAAASYNALSALKEKAVSDAVASLYAEADAQYLTPINEALNTSPESAEAAQNAANELETLVANAVMGKVLGAGVDMTSKIKGAMMPEDGNFAEHWTTDYSGGREANGMRRNAGEEPTVWNFFEGYYDTNCYEYDNWHWTLSQELNLPAGDYTIAVMCRAAAAEHEYTMTIGEESIALHSQGNANQELGNGWARVFKTFKITATEQGAQNAPSLAADEVKTYPVTLKVHTGVGAVKNNWFSFNNFKLVQNKAEDNPTGIEMVEVEENATAVYYNLNGVRVDGNNLTPGVYVVRRGAKAEKILVK